MLAFRRMISSFPPLTFISSKPLADDSFLLSLLLSFRRFVELILLFDSYSLIDLVISSNRLYSIVTPKNKGPLKGALISIDSICVVVLRGTKFEIAVLSSNWSHFRRSNLGGEFFVLILHVIWGNNINK